MNCIDIFVCEKTFCLFIFKHLNKKICGLYTQLDEVNSRDNLILIRDLQSNWRQCKVTELLIQGIEEMFVGKERSDNKIIFDEKINRELTRKVEMEIENSKEALEKLKENNLFGLTPNNQGSNFSYSFQRVNEIASIVGEMNETLRQLINNLSRFECYFIDSNNDFLEMKISKMSIKKLFKELTWSIERSMKTLNEIGYSENTWNYIKAIRREMKKLKGQINKYKKDILRKHNFKSYREADRHLKHIEMNLRIQELLKTKIRNS